MNTVTIAHECFNFWRVSYSWNGTVSIVINKRNAVKEAKEIAKSNNALLIIKNKDGSVSEEVSYRKKPKIQKIKKKYSDRLLEWI